MNSHGHEKKRGKSHSHSLFSLGCGCKDFNSVSVSRSTTETTTDKSSLTARRAINNPSSTETLTLTQPSISTSSYWEAIGDVDETASSASTPVSFSGLLRELTELENNVKELGTESKTKAKSKISPQLLPDSLSNHEEERGRSGGRLLMEKSIAVIKESEDPFGDFKNSMLLMIVENEIVSKEEMQELLQRFLLLNSGENHYVIVRAFMEIWNEIFEKTPKLPLTRGGSNCTRNRHYRASKKL